MPAFLRLTLLLVLAPTHVAQSLVTKDCALAGADCTIGEAARQAHVYVGTITSAQHSPAQRELLAANFNATTPENEMKWGSIAATVGNYDFAAADEIAAYADAEGLRLRMHTLLWGRLQLPQDLTTQVAAANDPAALLRKLIDEHFRTMTTRYGSSVALWDVVNEPLSILSGAYDANVFHETLGAGYVAEAFQKMRALVPDAELFLNEFVLDVPSEKADALVALVADLRARGIPIDGVGIQAHFFPLLPLPEPAAIEHLLRRLADTGVHVELTEVDVAISHFLGDPDPFARQAEYFGAIAAACMAVPACQGITMWGLTDDESWLDSFPPWDGFAPNLPLLFDAALQRKPAYAAVRDAIAARAVPYAEQAGLLRRSYRAAQRLRVLDHSRGIHALRNGSRVLRAAQRRLRAGDYVQACIELAAVQALLADATGAAGPDLLATVSTLRDDLEC